MTEREEAVLHFQWLKKRLCEEWQKFIPKDSIAYKASEKEAHYYDMAISALSAEGKPLEEYECEGNSAPADKEYINKGSVLDIASSKHMMENPNYHDVIHQICEEIKDLPTCSLSSKAESGEYIKKEDIELGLEKEYSHSLSEHDSHVFVEFMAFINELPTYSFPDREKGEWIERRNKATGHIESVCSVCGAEESYPYNLFCPNCGADMRGKAE